MEEGEGSQESALGTVYINYTSPDWPTIDGNNHHHKIAIHGTDRHELAKVIKKVLNAFDVRLHD